MINLATADNSRISSASSQYTRLLSSEANLGNNTAVGADRV